LSLSGPFFDVPCPSCSLSLRFLSVPVPFARCSLPPSQPVCPVPALRFPFPAARCCLRNRSAGHGAVFHRRGRKGLKPSASLWRGQPSRLSVVVSAVPTLDWEGRSARRAGTQQTRRRVPEIKCSFFRIIAHGTTSNFHDVICVPIGVVCFPGRVWGGDTAASVHGPFPESSSQPGPHFFEEPFAEVRKPVASPSSAPHTKGHCRAHIVFLVLQYRLLLRLERRIGLSSVARCHQPARC
jgi:hypothetical protein